MTATKRQMSNVAGMGSLLVNGHLPLWTSDLPQMGPFLRYAVSSYFGPVDVRPAVAIGLTVATEGYYLISVTATAAKASLRLGNLPWPYRAVAGGEWDHTLTLGMTSGYSSYPVVVKLTAGAPYNFYWTIDANPASGATACVSEVSVYKL